MRTISIILPFFKYKHYFKECLQNLAQSTFKDFELIVVLDHPTEDIDDLLEEYNSIFDMRIYTLPEGVTGVAACRNVGIQQAKGAYLYFLDSDDYVLEDTLQNMIKAMDHDVDMVYGILNHTWNNKANYLHKVENKEVDEEDQEEREQRRLNKLSDFVSFASYEKDEQQAQAIFYTMDNRRGIRTFTVLGNLYNRDFVVRNNFKFNENFRYYSDMTFMCPLLEKLNTFLRVEDAIYVKRKHNDPINEPALSQEENDNRFNERCDAVEYTRTLLKEEGVVRFCLDRKIVSYFVSKMSKRIRRSQDDLWRTDYFERIAKTIDGIRPEVMNRYKRNSKKMVACLQNRDLKGVQSCVRRKLGIKKFFRVFKNKNVLFKLAYYHIYSKKPIQDNVILFETFMAKNYSDSPKYIYEYIAKNYPGKYKCVWALNDGHEVPYGAEVVKRFSFKYAYYLAVSKYFVFNVRQPLWYRKREGQVFVETWHGTPLKRLVFDQEEVTSASPKYKQQFYRQRQEWDYLVSANPFSTKTFRSCFMYDGKMLEYGYPRNDILYWPNKDEIAKDLRKKLGIPEDKKTILYAPTWRDDEHYGKGEYKFTLALDLKLMMEKLSDEYVVLLRTHHYIADNIDTTGLEGFVYNLSKYDDISEIYLISDICITDYSSVFFDFANLKRPVLFYTYDIEKYKNQLRGFYIDMNTEVPGPLLYTSEEVVNAILNIDQINEEYKERYEEFYKRFCCYDDGNASKHIVEEVFK